MTYVCIKCGDIWDSGKPSDDHSGALCNTCATGYVRERQKKNGFHDCYKRAIEVCSEEDCSYWHLCNRELMGQARAAQM